MNASYLNHKIFVLSLVFGKSCIHVRSLICLLYTQQGNTFVGAYSKFK